MLFLDANDAVLIKRYKETRRTHPLAGSGRLESGIEKEREKLAPRILQPTEELSRPE